MFETLENVLRARSRRGPVARAVVWAHNVEIGEAKATEMGVRGAINMGQLCRTSFGGRAFSIGFGTDRGTFMGARAWDGPREVLDLLPGRYESYERVMHDTELRAFALHLREPPNEDLRPALDVPRLERGIGVIYRPDSELESHYFEAALPRQFDAWIWFDETEAIHPLEAVPITDLPDTYPFGL